VDQYGDLGGVVFNIRNQQLVGGNQRSTVFSPGDEIVIVESHDEPTEVGTVAWGYVLHNGEKFNYREVDWDDTKHAAAGLMANKAGGEWDWALLTPMMSELDALGGLEDLEMTGFNHTEWENMLGADAAAKANIESPAEGQMDRGTVATSHLENYENQALRKIELWVERENYEATIQLLDQKMHICGATSYSEVFLAALKAWQPPAVQYDE